MIQYMLDTDTVSYLLRGQSKQLDQHIARMPYEALCISAITRGELLYGLYLKEGAHRLEKMIEQFLARVPCLPWDTNAATHFAFIAAQLHRSGTQIGTMDALIAGHALSTKTTLVTNNVRHFECIEQLRVENWAML